MEKEMEIDLKKILLMVKKKWKAFVACGLIGVLAAFLVATYLIAPKYTSKVEFYAYVKNDGEIPVSDNAGGASVANTQSTFTIKMVPTYLTFLQTDDFYENIKEATNLDLTASQIKGMITYAQTQDTSVFKATVTSNNAETSKKIADYIGEAAPRVISQTSDGLVNVKVIDPAVKGLAEKASYPMYCAVGLLLGLGLAFAYALIRDMLDVHFKTEEDLATRYNIPLLGAVPDFESKSARKAGGR